MCIAWETVYRDRKYGVIYEQVIMGHIGKAHTMINRLLKLKNERSISII